MADLEIRLQTVRDAVDLQAAFVSRKLRELSLPQSGAIGFGEPTQDDDIISQVDNKIVCHGNWTGYLFMHYMYSADRMSIDYRQVTGSVRSFYKPSSVGSVAIYWFRRPGKALTADLSTGSLTPADGVWTTASSKTISSGDWTAKATVGWDAATYTMPYGIRILSNGSVVAQVGPHNGVGPLTPFGDGYRTQTVSAAKESINQTQKIEVQVYAASSTASSQRKVRRVMATLDWIEN